MPPQFDVTNDPVQKPAAPPLGQTPAAFDPGISAASDAVDLEGRQIQSEMIAVQSALKADPYNRGLRDRASDLEKRVAVYNQKRQTLEQSSDAWSDFLQKVPLKDAMFTVNPAYAERAPGAQMSRTGQLYRPGGPAAGESVFDLPQKAVKYAAGMLGGDIDEGVSAMAHGVVRAGLAVKGVNPDFSVAKDQSLGGRLAAAAPGAGEAAVGAATATPIVGGVTAAVKNELGVPLLFDAFAKALAQDQAHYGDKMVVMDQQTNEVRAVPTQSKSEIFDEAAQGAGQFLNGAMSVSGPGMVEHALAKPAAMFLAMAGGMGADTVTKYVAEKAGLGEGTSGLIAQIAGLATFGGMAHLEGGFDAERARRAPLEAARDDYDRTTEQARAVLDLPEGSPKSPRAAWADTIRLVHTDLAGNAADPEATRTMREVVGSATAARDWLTNPPPRPAVTKDAAANWAELAGNARQWLVDRFKKPAPSDAPYTPPAAPHVPAAEDVASAARGPQRQLTAPPIDPIPPPHDPFGRLDTGDVLVPAGATHPDDVAIVVRGQAHVGDQTVPRTFLVGRNGVPIPGDPHTLLREGQMVPAGATPTAGGTWDLRAGVHDRLTSPPAATATPPVPPAPVTPPKVGDEIQVLDEDGAWKPSRVMSIEPDGTYGVVDPLDPEGPPFAVEADRVRHLPLPETVAEQMPEPAPIETTPPTAAPKQLQASAVDRGLAQAKALQASRVPPPMVVGPGGTLVPGPRAQGQALGRLIDGMDRVRRQTTTALAVRPSTAVIPFEPPPTVVTDLGPGPTRSAIPQGPIPQRALSEAGAIQAGIPLGPIPRALAVIPPPGQLARIPRTGRPVSGDALGPFAAGPSSIFSSIRLRAIPRLTLPPHIAEGEAPEGDGGAGGTPATAPPEPSETPSSEVTRVFEPTRGATVANAQPGDMFWAPTHEITADPKRFQFKTETGANGVRPDSRIDNYDPRWAGVLDVWRDPADNRLYVINGFHRFDAAGRSGAPAVAVKVVDAGVQTAAEARVYGAMKNLAEGSAKPVDIAKLIREMNPDGRDPEDTLKDLRLSTRTRLAQEGVALSRLSDPLFVRVATGELPEDIGVAIGRGKLSPENQMAVVRLVERQEKKGKKITGGVVTALIDQVQAAPQAVKTDTSAGAPQGNIFEDILGEDRAQSTAFEQAELTDWLATELTRDKRALKRVANAETAARLAEGGNVIDVEKSRALAGEKGIAADYIQRMLNKKGPINDALKAAALRAVGGDDLSAVRTDLLVAIKDAVRAETTGAVGTTARGREGEPPTPGSGAAPRNQPGDARARAGRLVGAAPNDPLVAAVRAAVEFEKDPAKQALLRQALEALAKADGPLGAELGAALADVDFTGAELMFWRAGPEFAEPSAIVRAHAAHALAGDRSGRQFNLVKAIGEDPSRDVIFQAGDAMLPDPEMWEVLGAVPTKPVAVPVQPTSAPVEPPAAPVEAPVAPRASGPATVVGKHIAEVVHGDIHVTTRVAGAPKIVTISHEEWEDAAGHDDPSVYHRTLVKEALPELAGHPDEIADISEAIDAAVAAAKPQPLRVAERVQDGLRRAVGKDDDRWAPLRAGATDEQIREVLSKRFDLGGGVGGPGYSVEWKGGKHPYAKVDTGQQNAAGGTEKVTLRGKALIDATRRLLQIPKPDVLKQTDDTLYAQDFDEAEQRALAAIRAKRAARAAVASGAVAPPPRPAPPTSIPTAPPAVPGAREATPTIPPLTTRVAAAGPPAGKDIGQEPIGIPGRYKDVKVAEIAAKDPVYTRWILNSGTTPRALQVAEYLRTAGRTREAQVVQGAIAHLTPEITANLDAVKMKAMVRPDGLINLTGKTYDQRDLLKQAGARFDRTAQAWVLPANRLAPLSDTLRRVSESRGGQRSGVAVATYLRSPELARRRVDLEGGRDERDLDGPVGRYLDPDTQALVTRGARGGVIPPHVVVEQIEDAARIVRAFERDWKTFVLASDPGSGKSYVAGAALREIQKRGAERITYVTLSHDLIAQLQDDLKDFGLTNVTWTTYNKMRETPPEATDALVFDEAHKAKNIGTMTEGGTEREGGSRQGNQAADWVAKARFTMFMSATPFENPVQVKYLEPTGIFAPAGGADNFSMLFGATRRGGDNGMVVWQRTTTSDLDAAKAREWFLKQGIYQARKIRLPMRSDGTPQVDTRLVKVTVSPEWENRYSGLVKSAVDFGGELGTVGRMWMQNFLKRILEASKVDVSIKEAGAALARGRYPVIYVETKAERSYDIPDLIQREQEWRQAAAMARAMREAPPRRVEFGLPPQGIVQVLAGYMDRTGEKLLTIPSAEDVIMGHFGADQVAVYTGSVSAGAAKQNLQDWRLGVKPVMVATIDKAGSGLSLHDKVGNHQTTQINTNLPWTATSVVQVSLRTGRYGLKGNAEVQWLFAHNVPFDRTLATRVGGRMADMGAVVHGMPTAEAAKVENWDFEDKPFSELLPDRLEHTEQPRFWDELPEPERQAQTAAQQAALADVTPPAGGTEDILSTGEIQPRLPGDVGAVRDREVPQPKLAPEVRSTYNIPNLKAVFNLTDAGAQAVHALIVDQARAETSQWAIGFRAADEAEDAKAQAIRDGLVIVHHVAPSALAAVEQPGVTVSEAGNPDGGHVALIGMRDLAAPGARPTLDDFDGAVIPKSAEGQLKPLLEKNRVPYRVYDDSGTVRSRQDERDDTVIAFRAEIAQRLAVYHAAARPIGSITFSGTGAILRGSARAGLDTAFEEMFHGLFRQMYQAPESERMGVTDTDLNALADWAGAERGPDGKIKWTAAAEEQAAAGAKKFVLDNETTSDELRSIFGRILKAMREHFDRVLRAVQGIKLPPEVQKAYRHIFGRADWLRAVEARRAMESAREARVLREQRAQSSRNAAMGTADTVALPFDGDGDTLFHREAVPTERTVKTIADLARDTVVRGEPFETFQARVDGAIGEDLAVKLRIVAMRAWRRASAHSEVSDATIPGPMPPVANGGVPAPPVAPMPPPAVPPEDVVVPPIAEQARDLWRTFPAVTKALDWANLHLDTKTYSRKAMRTATLGSEAMAAAKNYEDILASRGRSDDARWARLDTPAQTAAIADFEKTDTFKGMPEAKPGEVKDYAAMKVAPDAFTERYVERTELAHWFLSEARKGRNGQPGDVGWIANYYPHMLKFEDEGRVDEATELLTQLWRNKFLKADPSVMKRRILQMPIDEVIATLAERGITAELRESNPERAAQWGLANAYRIYRFKQLGDQLVTEGLAKDVPSGQKPPKGWKALADTRFQTFFRTDEGWTLKSTVYAPPEVKKLLDRASQYGITPDLAYRALSDVNNALTSVKLGISAFHAFELMFITSADSVALGVRQMRNGDITGGGESFLRAATLSGTFGDRLARGRHLRAQLRRESPAAQQFLDDVVNPSGTVLRLDSTVRTQFAKRFLDAWRDRRVVAACGLAAPAFAEMVGRPLVEAIENVKMGTLIEWAPEVRKAMPDGASEQDYQQRLRDLSQSLDNRIGMLTYNNLFWSATALAIAKLTMLSLGWNHGTMLEVGGGVKDLASGKVSDRVMFDVGMLMVHFYTSAIYQYAHTGKLPENLHDFYAPKDGTTDANGLPGRMVTKNYVTDAVNFVHDPVTTTLNRESPLIGAMRAFAGFAFPSSGLNRDWRGDMMTNPDAPQAIQAAQFGKFLLGLATPISVQKAADAYGSDGAGAAAERGLTPFQRAPRWLEEPEIVTATRQRLQERVGVRVRTPEMVEVDQLKAQARRELLAGDNPSPAFQRLLTEGAIKAGDGAQRFMAGTFHETAFQRMWNELPAADQRELAAKYGWPTGTRPK